VARGSWRRVPAGLRLAPAGADGRALATPNGKRSPTCRGSIKRIVRQNLGRFRMCYSSGLGRNPKLQGLVSVQFVVAPDGSVSSASDGGSKLPDAAVVSCVVSVFYGLSFPARDEGIVRVQYPLTFEPG